MKIAILSVLSVFAKPKDALLVQKTICQYPKWMQIVYNLVYFVGQIFPLSWRTKLVNWFAKNCFCGDGRFVHRSNDQYMGIGQIFPASLITDYQTVLFEETKLMVFKNFQDVLIESYGNDYMIPVRYGESETEIHNKVRDILKKKTVGGGKE